MSELTFHAILVYRSQNSGSFFFLIRWIILINLTSKISRPTKWHANYCYKKNERKPQNSPYTSRCLLCTFLTRHSLSLTSHHSSKGLGIKRISNSIFLLPIIGIRSHNHVRISARIHPIIPAEHNVSAEICVRVKSMPEPIFRRNFSRFRVNKLPFECEAPAGWFESAAAQIHATWLLLMIQNFPFRLFVSPFEWQHKCYCRAHIKIQPSNVSNASRINIKYVFSLLRQEIEWIELYHCSLFVVLTNTTVFLNDFDPLLCISN